MNKEEKVKLKLEYNNLKQVYKDLKEELILASSDSKENFEMRGELMIIMRRMQEIRRKLIDATFSKYYPTTLLENFVYGKENVRGGR